MYPAHGVRNGDKRRDFVGKVEVKFCIVRRRRKDRSEGLVEEQFKSYQLYAKISSRSLNCM